MKTSELKGKALNWVVAKIEAINFVITQNGLLFEDLGCEAKGDQIDYLDAKHGGALLLREKISIREGRDGMWAAYKGTGEGNTEIYWMTGETQLEAAMRCHVASKYGDVVEIPEGLL